MALSLVVTTAFGDHAVGDRITDAAEAERLAGSPFVVAAAPPPTAPVTEQELRERAAALEAIQRVDAKLQQQEG